MTAAFKAALLASAIMLTPVAASAQSAIPVTPAGADGRFTTQLDPKTRVPGFPVSVVATHRAALTALTDRLVAMPEVNSPSAPMCMDVASWVEVQSERGLVESSVDVSRPVIVDGRCTRLMGSTIQFWINRTDNLFRSRLKHGEAADGEGWYALPIIEMTDRSIRLEDDGEEIEVYLHGRAPLLRAISWSEYAGPTGGGGAFTEADFQAWLAHDFAQAAEQTRAEARANVAQIADPAVRQAVLEGVEAGLAGQPELMRGQIGRQRREIEAEMGKPFSRPPQAVGQSPDTASATWACWRDYQVIEAAACPVSQRLVALNPAYFDTSRAGDAQLILVRTSIGPEKEDGLAYEERRAIWRALDRPALAAMVAD